MSDEPILLTVLRGILHLLGWVCALFSLPTWGMMLCFEPFVTARSIWSKNDGSVFAHAVLWPLRWAIGVVWTAAATTAYWPVLLWGVFRGRDDIVGIVVGGGIAGLFGQLFGLIYVAMHISSFKDLEKGRFIRDVCFSWLDLLACGCLFVGLASVVRVPALMLLAVGQMSASRYTSMSRRTALMVQPLMAIVDLLGLPALLLTFTVFFWRSGDVIRRVKNDDSAWSAMHDPEVHILAYVAVFNALVDIVCWIAGLFVVLTPWRWPTLAKDLDEAFTSQHRDTLQDLRGIGLAAMFYAGADYATILAALLACCTGIRIPYMLYEGCKVLAKDTSGSSRQRELYELAWTQLLFAFLDVVTLICFTIVIAFGYRVVLFGLSIKESVQYSRLRWDNLHVHECAWYQIANQVVDLPFLLAAACTLVFFWRAPYMVYLVVKGERYDRREIILRQFFFGLTDILVDVWFLAAVVLMTATVWRAFALLPQLKQELTGKHIDDLSVRCNLRLAIITHMFLWVLDIPLVLIGSVVFVTGWRAPRLVRILFGKYEDLRVMFERSLPAQFRRQAARTGFDADWYAQQFRIHKLVAREFVFWLLDLVCLPFMLIVAVSWRAPSLFRTLRAAIRRRDFGDKVHLIILTHALSLAIDVPFVLMGIGCLWRIPFLLLHIHKHCHTEYERRFAAARYFWYFLLDLPCLLVIVLVHTVGLCAPWRMVQFWKRLRTYKRTENEHALVFSLFLMLLADLPHVLLGIIGCVIAPWRTIQQLKLAWKGPSAPDVYAEMYITVMLGIADWLSIAGTLVLLATLVRFRTVCLLFRDAFVYHRHNETENRAEIAGSYYGSVAGSLVLAVWDCMVIGQLIAVLALLVRLPAVLVRMLQVVVQFFASVRPVRPPATMSVAVDATALTAGANSSDDRSHASHESSQSLATEWATLRKACMIGPTFASDWKLAEGDAEAQRDFCHHSVVNSRSPAERLGLTWSWFSQIVAQEWDYTVLVWLGIAHLPFIATGWLLSWFSRAIAVRFFYKQYGFATAKFREIQWNETWYYNSISVHRFLIGAVLPAATTNSPFWTADSGILASICSLALWVMHDLALFPAAVTSIFIIILTGGARWWGKAVVESAKERYNRFERILTIMFVIQCIFGPLIILLQLILFFIPFFAYHARTLTFEQYWTDRQDIWDHVWDVPASLWVWWAAWMFILVTSWFLVAVDVFKHYRFIRSDTHRHVTLYGPLYCYWWAITHLFKGRMWKFYKAVLGVPTSILYTWRSSCLKNLLLIIWFFAWSCWPIGLDWAVKEVWMYCITAVASAFLMWRGYKVVEENWRPSRPLPSTPAVTLTSAIVSFPTPIQREGGRLSYRRLVFELRGTKHREFGEQGSVNPASGSYELWSERAVLQVELHIGEDPFWMDVKAVLGGAKYTAAKMAGVNKIKLCPQYWSTTAHPIKSGTTDFHAVLDFDFRTMEKAGNIRRLLEQIASRSTYGPTPLVLKFVYGISERGNYSPKGILFTIHTTAQALLDSADHQSSFVQGPARPADEPSPDAPEMQSLTMMEPPLLLTAISTDSDAAPSAPPRNEDDTERPVKQRTYSV